MGESLSPSELIPCGVPQGSALSLLLFLIHIIDIHISSNGFDFKLIVGDTSIFLNKNDILEGKRLR